MSGFLGTRAPFMFDVVFTAMFLVLPAMVWAIREVRVKRNFARHRQIMTVLVSVLAVTVVAFEVDIRFFHPWQEYARESRFYETPWYSSTVGIVLIIHLCFAISTTILWAVVSVRAWRRFPRPPRPSEHSRFHVPWAWLAAIDMVLTAVTGWIFYWMAFVA